MKFLIQTIDNKIVHDFAFTLIESLNFQNWITNSRDFKYKTHDCTVLSQNQIPVGTVEFVSEYFEKINVPVPKPRNIPECLFGYSKRKIINGTEKDISGNKFVKSNDKIKTFTEFCTSAPNGNYQISEIIEIESEYRCFIHKNNLVGLQNYSGSFLKFPNISAIENMISTFATNKAPVAYTLDVAITKYNQTVPIEVHDFFSCGLYGFAEHKIYPFMLSQWFFEYVRHCA